tara:strand:+ start:518 stop:667 length:150 start_codon:yes stop_codon:yes gene_type:complete
MSNKTESMKKVNYEYVEWQCPHCVDLSMEDRKHDRDLGLVNCPGCGGKL